MNKSILNKPFNNKIISQFQKERYILDLTYINDEIKDINYKFEYIFNIISQYSKLLRLICLKLKHQKMENFPLSN